MNAEIARKVVIGGRVQGVGFRAFVAREAKARGLRGWVRNRRDGSVEAVFAGDARVVADFIAACRRGPSEAHVDSVVETDAGSQDFSAGFRVLPSA